MLKKTITYEDYLGNTRTEDFYFNLSKTELQDLQMSVEGGLDKRLEKMIAAKNNVDVYKAFVDVVLMSYGELSEDGKFHLKEDENGHKLWKKFKQSPAYDVLMDEICQSTETVAAFCKGIVPHQKAKIEPQDHKKPEIHPVQ